MTASANAIRGPESERSEPPSWSLLLGAGGLMTNEGWIPNLSKTRISAIPLSPLEPPEADGWVGASCIFPRPTAEHQGPRDQQVVLPAAPSPAPGMLCSAMVCSEPSAQGHRGSSLPLQHWASAPVGNTAGALCPRAAWSNSLELKKTPQNNKATNKNTHKAL